MAKNTHMWRRLLLWAAFMVDSVMWQDVLLGFDFRGVYVVLVASLITMLISAKVIFMREVFWICLALFTWSLPSIMRSTDVAFVVGSQLIGGMGLGLFVSYLTINVGGLSDLARAYLKIAAVLSLSVIVEQGAYLVGGIDMAKSIFSFLPGRQFEGYLEWGVYRASGLFYEPSQVGLIVAPAVCLSLWLGRPNAVVLGAAAIVASFSTLGIVGLMLAAILGARNLMARLLLIVLSLATILSLSLFFDPVMMRIGTIGETLNDIFNGVQIDAVQLSERGGTVATLIANSAIAIHGMYESPVFGLGLGAFRIYYADMIDVVFPGASELTGFYNPAGSSLFLRMILELGVVGSGLVVFFYLHRMYRAISFYANDPVRIGWVLAASCFFLISLLRKDAFVSFYFWFFLVMFLYSTRLDSIRSN